MKRTIYTVEEPPFVYSFWSTAEAALKSMRRYRRVDFYKGTKFKVVAHILNTAAFTERKGKRKARRSARPHHKG